MMREKNRCHMRLDLIGCLVRSLGAKCSCPVFAIDIPASYAFRSARTGRLSLISFVMANGDCSECACPMSGRRAMRLTCAAIRRRRSGVSQDLRIEDGAPQVELFAKRCGGRFCGCFCGRTARFRRVQGCALLELLRITGDRKTALRSLGSCVCFAETVCVRRIGPVFRGRCGVRRFAAMRPVGCDVSGVTVVFRMRSRCGLVSRLCGPCLLGGGCVASLAVFAGIQRFCRKWRFRRWRSLR